jgi:hypothetical protein
VDGVSAFIRKSGKGLRKQEDGRIRIQNPIWQEGKRPNQTPDHGLVAYFALFIYNYSLNLFQAVI